jgi:predicted nucleic acid-binding protein
VKSRPIALVDSCVLHSACCRDLLIQLDIDGLLRLRWSKQILLEVEYSVLRRRPDLSSTQLRRTFALMNQTCPYALTESDIDLIGNKTLPDPNDNHILASALQAHAQIILTFNLKDFPSTILSTYGIKAAHPDNWFVSLHHNRPSELKSCTEKCRGRLRAPALSPKEYKAELKRAGLPHLSSLI